MCSLLQYLTIYQECVGAVSADDPESDGLVPRFWTVAADMDWSQVDDALTAQKTFKKNKFFLNQETAHLKQLIT